MTMTDNSLAALDALTERTGSGSNPIKYRVIKWSDKNETTLNYDPAIGRDVTGTMVHVTEVPSFNDDGSPRMLQGRNGDYQAKDTCCHFLLDDGEVVRVFASGQLYTAIKTAKEAAGFDKHTWPIRRYKVTLAGVVDMATVRPGGKGKAYNFTVAGPIVPEGPRVQAAIDAAKDVKAYYAERALNKAQDDSGPFDGGSHASEFAPQANNNYSDF